MYIIVLYNIREDFMTLSGPIPLLEQIIQVSTITLFPLQFAHWHNHNDNLYFIVIILQGYYQSFKIDYQCFKIEVNKW